MLRSAKNQVKKHFNYIFSFKCHLIDSLIIPYKLIQGATFDILSGAGTWKHVLHLSIDPSPFFP